jgi:hypothetical protein
MYSPGVPTYLVGEVPGAVPGADAFAAEGRVIGSVAWRDRSALAIAVARGVEDARERFEALAQEAGWTLRPAGPERRGFVPARSADPNRGFCFPADDAGLQIRAYPNSDGGGSYVVAEYSPARGGRFCARPPEPGPRVGGFHELAPTLRPPDGLHVMDSGMSSSDNEASTRAALFGEAAPAELVAHFERQLREQGWAVGDRFAGEETAVLSAEKRGEGGTPLALTVLIRRLADDEHSLSMHISRRR